MICDGPHGSDGSDGPHGSEGQMERPTVAESCQGKGYLKLSDSLMKARKILAFNS